LKAYDKYKEKSIEESKSVIITPQRLFAMLLVLTGCFSVYFIWKTKGGCVSALLAQKERPFCDFFSHIYYVKEPEKVYDIDIGACFPPLAYIMYWFLGKGLDLESTITRDVYELSSCALLLYITYNVILAMLFYDSIMHLAKKNGCEKRIAFAICTSGVFVLSVLWLGNSAWIVCILLMRALELRESKNWQDRELALILIALAAGLKMYPAAFGILYLKEKRYKEAVRLILYGMIAFIVPFVFFGGIHGMVQMVENQLQVHLIGAYGNGRSIQSIWNRFDSRLFHFNMPVIGVIGNVVYIILACAALWTSLDEWKRLYLLCSLMVVAPVWSGDYTPIYFSIPLIYFLREERKNKTDYLYACLFVGIFCFFVKEDIPLISNVMGHFAYVIRYASIFAICLMLLCETVLQIFTRRIGEKG